MLHTLRNAGVELTSFFGPALGNVFMISRPWIGCILWLALAERDARSVAFAVLGLLVGAGIGRVLRIGDVPGLGGGLRANGLLTAVAVGWVTAPADLPLAIQAAMAMAASATASIIAATVTRLVTGTLLPPLIWGYCVVAGMLFVLFPAWTILAANLMQPWQPPQDFSGWAESFLRSLGSLLFAPTVTTGCIIGTALVIWSRAVFVTGATAWLSGAATAVAFQKLGVIYYWLPASYNYFIAGMALGSVYFLPGRASLLIAAGAGFGASILGVFLQYVSPAWAYLPVSAGLTIWIGICALIAAEERNVIWRNFLRRVPPEGAWWRTNYWARRLGRHEPLLVLPLGGAVQISQSFDGELSHRGPWRHAFDLERPKTAEPQQTIWATPVTAPAAGVVERIRNDVPDNPLGICNYADSWGNFVEIRLDQGGWALLAHLRQGSIVVRPGMRVEIGTYLGTVGNSGRSPIPHLHLQAQRSPVVGAPTVPFRLANYEEISNGAAPHWIGAAVPDQGAVVAPAPPVPKVHELLAGISPGIATWMVEATGHIPAAFRTWRSGSDRLIAIVLDYAGRHVFRTESGDWLLTVADPDAWRIIDFCRAAAPFLKLLALAVPAIPYAAKAGMLWREPAIVPTGPGGRFGMCLAPYRKEPFTYVRCTCIAEPTPTSALVVETEVETARPDLPKTLKSQFELLRGPVRIEASFERGMLAYSLLSFEPVSNSGPEERDSAIEQLWD
jgi:hypothetical protein